MIENIYIDIDGVLADLNSFIRSHKLDINNKEKFFKYMIEYKAFRLLKPLPHDYLIDYLKDVKNVIPNLKVSILGSIGREDNTPLIDDKLYWLENNINFKFDEIIFVPRKEVKQIYADKKSVLIDDTESNVVGFILSKGKAILYRNQYDTVVDLKKILSKSAFQKKIKSRS
jgi:hypothetical protein